MNYINSLLPFFDRHPVYLYLLVFILFGLLRIGMLPFDPIGLPDDHDEFAYLLQAETFAEGRLANPSPQLWEHFESFHILVHPVYASKYPPGQSFFLFLGIKLFGHAWYGVLLSCMVMVVCLVWMIRGYTTIGWTLLAAVFIILRFGLWHYWASSYWGGAVAATGGALVFGALPRFRKRDKYQLLLVSFCFGLGIVMLSQTRPFEGLLVSLLPGLYFLNKIYQRIKKKQFNNAMQILLPAFLLILLNFCFTAYYNYKVTGSALTMPYRLHSQQYSIQSPFLFVNHREPLPAYNHEILEKHYNGWELIEINSWKDYLRVKRTHFIVFTGFFYYWPLLVAACFIFIDRKGIEIPYWSFLLFCCHLLFTSWFQPHYFAPAIAIYYLLLVSSVKYLIEHQNKWVKNISTAVIVAGLLVTFYNSRFFATRHSGYINGTQPYVEKKQQVLEKLKEIEGDHIVLVKYGDNHKLHEEWVYNGPDLDKGRILWVRYISEMKTKELKDYFKNRNFWFVYGDESPARLIKY